jgi:hypothetical protein
MYLIYIFVFSCISSLIIEKKSISTIFLTNILGILFFVFYDKIIENE